MFISTIMNFITTLTLGPLVIKGGIKMLANTFYRIYIIHLFFLFNPSPLFNSLCGGNNGANCHRTRQTVLR